MTAHRGTVAPALRGAIALTLALSACACTSGAGAADSALTYKLPSVGPSDRASVSNYLQNQGDPLLKLHRAAAAVAATYSVESCTALLSLLAPTAQPTLEAAAVGVPDSVLTELAADEIHAVAQLRGCAKSQSVAQLRSVDGLLQRRLLQFGVS